MKPKKAKIVPAEAVESPAKIRFGHVRGRVTALAAGSKLGFTNIRAYPLLTAVSLKRPRIAEDEFLSGEVYRVAWEMRFPQSSDAITRIGMVVSGGKCDLTERQIHAGDFLRAIDKQMMKLAPPCGEPHLTIIREFCGAARSAREACLKANIKDPRDTWGAVRLALSKLCTAISKTHINLSRENTP